MDLGGFAAPMALASLAHGAGVAAGAAGCLLAPPRYEEPPVRRRYRLAESLCTAP